MVYGLRFTVYAIRVNFEGLADAVVSGIDQLLKHAGDSLGFLDQLCSLLVVEQSDLIGDAGLCPQFGF